MNLRATLARLPWPLAVVRLWDGASPRERTLVRIAGAIVLLAAAWAAVWQPLAADTARLTRERMRDGVVLATARADAEEIAGLQRSPAPERSSDVRAAVERVLAERGLRPMLASLDVQEGRVRATFTAIRLDALVGALDALAKSDGVFPVEMTLTPRVEPGTLRAELTLARP
jgi:type II secretory pathway component PulM